MNAENATHQPRQPRIVVVGAGVSGICATIQLLQAGFTDITVCEKGDEFGGTWRENTYPGLACDVMSRVYQFTFAKNPDWSHLFSPGSEIKDYLAEVARKYGVDHHTRFGTQVTTAEFAAGEWWITTAEGQRTACDFLVCATGYLHHPRLPDITGLQQFVGSTFHSARWNHETVVQGMRVGVIGTGSTGIQLVSAMAGVAAHLVLFQRTAQWIVPAVNWRYSRIAKFAHRRIPMLGNLAYRFGQQPYGLIARATARPGLQRRLIGWACARYLRTVRDPELRRKLTPDYAPMCKRLVMANGFYRAIQRPDVELVTASIDHVAPDGVVTVDGSRHKLDVLVLATGFDAHAFMAPMAITGPNGVTLEQVWADGPRAFEGMMLPGFPNLFLMNGPYSPFGNHPIIAISEAQAHRIVWWARRWRNGEFSSVEPTDAAMARFHDRMRAAMPGTVWTSGCQSWYLGKDGLPELWPSTGQEYEELIARHPDHADYQLDRWPVAAKVVS
ncbi:flavin-containing monooxygenase [Nocardia suismassiliense]|uniref:flavin-containing monooxygenase n=1 Tax=Nocardia suismassiliense TaxID=2077092 RepID=UPI000D1E27CC|nr:NAD(P)/FAD-dependent oxidoreductase [Nocardia suismassiliense]